MQNDTMRTTITLTEEAHDFAAYYARARGLTLSAAIDELIKRVEAGPAVEKPPLIEYLPDGMPIFPRTGTILTSEMVRAALDDDNK
jgi:hypothetical protein